MSRTYTPYDLLAALRDRHAAQNRATQALISAENDPDDFEKLKLFVSLADDADRIGALVEREARFKGQEAA